MVVMALNPTRNRTGRGRQSEDEIREGEGVHCDGKGTAICQTDKYSRPFVIYSATYEWFD